MNKFDVKVLLEETRKQTARDIIRDLVAQQSACLFGNGSNVDAESQLEEGKITFTQYKALQSYNDGYFKALQNAINSIENRYDVGARKILEAANSKPE